MIFIVNTIPQPHREYVDIWWTFPSSKPSSSRAASAAHFPLRSVLVSTETSNPFASSPAVPQTAITSLRVPSHRHESLPPPPHLLPLRFVSGGLTSRRRFASIRSGRHLRRSHPFLSSHWTVTLIVTRRYLKDKFSSSPYSCFVSRFLLRFCLVLRRSLSSSSSQLNNTLSHSSAHSLTP